MASDDKVLIIGAGIGGLTLARALTRAGIPCELFERSPELRAVGAGITIQTAAMLALRTLGLDEAVAAAGEELRLVALLTDAGKTLTRTSVTFLKEELGASTVALHRGRLQEVLLASVEGVPLHLGAALTTYESDATSVTATFANGTSVRGRLLVGADGLHSAVRRQLLGDTPLRYAGYTSWRGIAATDAAFPRHEAAELWGRGARFGCAGLGHGETYWFGVLDAPPGGTDAQPLEAVKRHFAGFGGPAPALLAATAPERVLRTDIHDRAPVARWSAGRVVLLGDAAHPTTPNLGQGGCMAIEDAVVLAHALGRAPSFVEAFAAYEAARVARTNATVDASNRFGRIAQLRNPVGVWARNVALRLTPTNTMRRQLRKSAGFSLDGVAVDARSLTPS